MQYVYCVLPFGLNASAGTFCRFTAVVARAVRASGLTSASIVYIDDFGCALGPAATPADALEVITIIKSFGFSVSEPKTNLLMLTVMDLLGFTLDTSIDVMEFRVPERRLRKLEDTAGALLGKATA